MAIKVIVGAFFATTLATGAFAQDCSNPLNAGNRACIGFATPSSNVATISTQSPAPTVFIPLSNVVPAAVGVTAAIGAAVASRSRSTTSTD